MSLASLHNMQAKRLADAQDRYGYATPGLSSVGGRSLQALGVSLAGVVAPSGNILAMLSVYQHNGHTYINRGFVGSTEISGTGRVNLGAGDRVYVRCQIERESKFWFTTTANPPLEGVDLRYLTGAVRIQSASILIVQPGDPAPQDETASDGGNTISHLLTYTMPANGLTPADGSPGGWIQLSPSSLTL